MTDTLTRSETLTSLAKKARVYANDPMWADHCEVRKGFMHSLADKMDEAAGYIEKLEAECDALSKDCTTRYERHRKKALDDLRDWCEKISSELDVIDYKQVITTKSYIDAYEADLER